MGARTSLFCLVGGALSLAAPAYAADSEQRYSVNLKAGLLTDALREVSLKSGTGLLFAPEIVGNRRNRRLAGTMTLDAILHSLLEGSGLTFRRTSAGTIVILVAPVAEQEPAYPEILVVGRRTQNTDIRRSQNDIQPYQVAYYRDIAASHSDNIDQFLRRRLPSNTVLEGPSQIPVSTYGSNRSEVNLHGLGANQTLVLIDGVRLPGVPVAALRIDQPDLNGVPLLAIERIETLTGTAGGIHGPGAIGGTINVVMKRDYRGADFALTRGISSRGDAPQTRVEGRVGFTPDGGRTDVMVAFARSATTGLRLGDRDFAQTARQLEIARSPEDFLSHFPTGNGLIIRSARGENLSLKPELGGTSLGSSFTYLPVGYGGISEDGGAALLVNGGIVPALAPDGSGAMRSLTGDTRVASLLLNARHHFGENIEAFIDLMAFENDGRIVAGTLTAQNTAINSLASSNPFRQSLYLALPLPGFDTVGNNRLRTVRLSVGGIARLPFDWRAEANYSAGWVRNTVETAGFELNRNFSTAVGLNRPGAGGEPAPNPFGDWNSFVRALQAYKIPRTSFSERHNHLEGASLRLAGPLFARDAGVVSLSLLADHRRERISASTDVSPSGTPSSFEPPIKLTTSSLYGELRAPVLGRDQGPPLLRGLEFQLAVRYDDFKSFAPIRRQLTYQPPVTRQQAATAFTAGVRVFPLDRLMVRASVATGVLPPTPEQLLETVSALDAFYFRLRNWIDPRRNGMPLGAVTVTTRGSSQLKPERARTLAFGIVVNPEGAGRPRISLDYTHIEKRDEVSYVHNFDVPYFLAHEERYPERVIRAPLTPQDAAAGLSGGVITRMETGALNIGRTTIDAIDLQLDYELTLGAEEHLRLYGSATWQPRFRRREGPDTAPLDYVGFADGTLRWRGHFGAGWSKGPFSLGANGQYYDAYYGFAAASARALTDASELEAPGVRIPFQFYFDISAGYQFDLRGDTPFQSLGVRLDVTNVFDHQPPIDTSSDLSYSAFGDARGRRFAVTLSSRF